MPRFNKPVLLATAASVLLCSAAISQEAQKPAALSLAECIDVAMRHQTDVITAQNNITIAKSKLAQNASSYLPQIAIQNNAFTWGQKGVLTQSTTGTALTVDQNIYDGGVREANVVGARYGVKQNAAAYERTKQGVAYDVTSAYYEVLRAKHLAEVRETNVKYNESLRDQIKLQAEQGEAATVDVLPVEAQLANAQVDLISARNAVRTAAINLQSAMGLQSQQGFDVQDVAAPPDVALQPLEFYTSAALKTRPDIGETQAGLGAARASVRSARVAMYPRPVISGNYQKSVAGGGFTSSGTQITGGIVFNLFNGGANRAAYRGAKASQANVEQQAQQLDRNIRAQVEEAYINFANAKERLAASQVSVNASQKNLEAQNERYKQGIAIALDLLNAQVQLVTAQSNAVQAKYDYYTAVAQLDYAVGKQGGFNGN